MRYRPQFVFPPPPPGWIDEEFVYVFDAQNTPALAQGLLPGDLFQNIQLPLETDAEYRVRSIELITSPASGTYGIRFRDAFGTLMSANGAFVLSDVYARAGAAQVPLEPQEVSPAGSRLQADITRFT
jgi:hypothetical protein